MLNALKKNILTIKELMGIATEQDFLKRFGLKELKPLEEATLKLLQKNHAYYVSHVSSAEMAASLELSVLLYRLATSLNVTAALDLGTGFSSYVLRLAAKNSSGFAVYSVDDDVSWLQKTTDYLKANEVPADHVLSLDAFKALHTNGFDLVLLDLNFVEVRKDHIADAITIANDKGIIIFDDTHKIEYLRHVKQGALEKKITLYNFRNSTLDAFKRFALIGIK
ncbi:MAG: hypothetical protein ACXVP0_07580 [Bacteroidia bacterium]